MKFSRYLFLILPFLLILSACTTPGDETGPLSRACYTNPQSAPSAQLALGSAEATYVPGRLLVSYRSAGYSADGQDKTGSKLLGRSARQQILRAATRTVREHYNLRLLGSLGQGAAELVQTSPRTDVQQLAEELRRDPRVRYAEPDYYLYPLGLPAAPPTDAPSGTVPNDPLIGEQWHLLDFGLPEAWALETGQSNVVLAVLDSGVDLTHEDLRGRVLPGCDVYNGDNNPSPGSPSQLGANQRHGTHVAGIALADGNNGKGVAGVAYTGVRLLPVKVFDDSGGDAQKTATSVVIKAIRWSAGLRVEGMNRNPYPAKIINLSLGGRGSGPDGTIESLNEAVEDARDQGSLVIAASGNEYLTSGIFAPANAPDALAVGSVDDNYRRSDFSNYSITGRSVDLVAPGGIGPSQCGSILSTLSPAFEGATESAYGCERGTSMASPFVAGVAALIWSQSPDLSADEVEAKLLSSTRYTLAMNAAEYGAGVICADRALGAETLCGK